MRKLAISLAVLAGAMLVPGVASAAQLTVSSVVAGAYHTCVIGQSGGVECFGRNGNGQLGDGTTNNSWSPVQVSGLTSGVTALAGGWYHTCAIMADRTARCWGLNANGELGNGTTTDSSVPVTVSGIGTITQLSAGSASTCAVTASGSVWCWGANADGELGNNTTTDSSVPVRVLGLGGAASSVAVGDGAACAVLTSGAVDCWGSNAYDQLGTYNQPSSQSAVAMTSLTSGISSVVAGHYSFCALTTTGVMECWGDNYGGIFANGTRTSSRTPVKITGLPGAVTQISSGYWHVCAIVTGGSLWCWGDDWVGELGDGQTGALSTAVQAVPGMGIGVSSVTTGYDDTCATTTGGLVYCWGLGYYGEIGNSYDNVSSPGIVGGLLAAVPAPSGGPLGALLAASLMGAVIWSMLRRASRRRRVRPLS